MALHELQVSMTRQSISLTSPNDDWLKSQIEREEYSSKSEAINDLIRKARKEEEEMTLIRQKLMRAEQRGCTDMRKEDILRLSKQTFPDREWITA